MSNLNPVHEPLPSATGTLSSTPEMPEKLLPTHSASILPERRPEILFISSYPPRQCGVATYTQDLLISIDEKFGSSFSLKVCALEEAGAHHPYPAEVKHILPVTDLDAYEALALKLNWDKDIRLIFLQHEFGLYGGAYGQNLLAMLCLLKKPVVTCFHTVLPGPTDVLKKVVEAIVSNSLAVVVMTTSSANILKREYDVPAEKITVIPHGTHLLSSFDHQNRSVRNHLGNRKVLTTFGLLGPGKSIETALDALPAIVKDFPDILYLVIGTTHPGVLAHEGEQYREMLQQKVQDLQLQNHVLFINRYLPLPQLLEYLQRTDIYLFTSKDPNQAVSGTFAYALSCGCPVISTPIPHAKEMLAGAGVIVDFQRPDQFAEAVTGLLQNPELMYDMKLNALHKTRPTAWPNAALAHVELVRKHMIRYSTHDTAFHYVIPPVSLAHVRKLTTPHGMIQFSKLSSPDIATGYTLDDNARALVAVTRYYKQTGDVEVLPLIEIYLNFVISCQRPGGDFINYFTAEGDADPRNQADNLEDANGRAVWALCEFLTDGATYVKAWTNNAEFALLLALQYALKMRSPRALSFVLKGLCSYNVIRNSTALKQQITSLADDLVSRYRGVSNKDWKWFEAYLTYANGVMPEALLSAYVATGSELFRDVAKSSFDFLLTIIFPHDTIKVISNQGWLKKQEHAHQFGEQPIDVAYTIMALDLFSEVFPSEDYREKMTTAFNWFLGHNHLRQIIYNPVTGGCYDGLEEMHVNLNQGAESTISYLLSRLIMEKKETSVSQESAGIRQLLQV